MPNGTAMLADYQRHRLRLQIHGLAIHDCSPYVKLAAESPNDGRHRYRDVVVSLHSHGEVQLSSLRFAQRWPTETPYLLRDKDLLENGRPTGLQVDLHPLRSSERLNGYYFPRIALAGGVVREDYALMRLNPRNTGRCPGKCRFCHRVMDMPTAEEAGRRFDLSPPELFEKILQEVPSSALAKVRRIVLLTTLFGSEDMFLGYLESLREQVDTWLPEAQLAATAVEVRSRAGMLALRRILHDAEFCFTLEVFARRQELMSRYKGVSLEEARNLLRLARDCGFSEVVVNYIAGLDSVDEYRHGLNYLRSDHLPDSVATMVFSCLTTDHLTLRKPEALHTGYYRELHEITESVGVSYFMPQAYERGNPFCLA